MSEAWTYPQERVPVAGLGVSERATFIGRTYSHLFGAVVAFVLFEILLFQTSLPRDMTRFLAGSSWRWLIFLGGFVLLGSLASRVAINAQSVAGQYFALFAFVLLEALIFMPLLLIANVYAPGAIGTAALLTLIGFAGLTAIVFVTRKDFSFLRSIVMYGGVIALLIIVGAIAFGFSLGMWFSVAMVALAGAAILYDTSNILHHYPVDKHVAASLALFASVALMFWYILRILIAMRD